MAERSFPKPQKGKKLRNALSTKTAMPMDNLTARRLTDNSPFIQREVYNEIRTKLLFTGNAESCPVYVVTSALPNDGKTINSVNISFAFARMGKRTLLIDADMRKPSMHLYHELPCENGLSEVLAGICEDPTIKETSVENLQVITAGKLPPNPAELLGSPRMGQMLQKLRTQYDCIFIDTPPVEIVSDAVSLIPIVTGHVFVVQAGSSKIPGVAHAVQMLVDLDANVVGFILNNIPYKVMTYGKSSRYPYYSYKYAYKRRRDDVRSQGYLSGYDRVENPPK